jgi:hypothetical protein
LPATAQALHCNLEISKLGLLRFAYNIESRRSRKPQHT